MIICDNCYDEDFLAKGNISESYPKRLNGLRKSIIC